MGLLDVVERCSEELTPVERRITEALLAAASEAAFLPVGEMARRAGAHPAAAVRLAKKLGFGGYRELKASLQSDLLGTTRGHSRLKRQIGPMSRERILASLIDAEIESLSNLRSQVDEARILAAAGALRHARQIFIYGQGHATALVDLAARRLNRHGYLVTAIREGQWSVPEVIARMSGEDVLITFAFYRVPEIVPALLAQSARAGAQSILFTDLVGIRIPSQPTHLIAATRGEPGQSHTLGVPMLLVNALILALVRTDEGRSLAALARVDALSEQLASATGGRTGARRKARKRR